MNTGPRCSTKSPVAMRSTLAPVMSAGIRSGVDWTRWNSRPSSLPSVRTASVLARPGHALDERVAAADDGQQQLADRLVLSDDGLCELAPRVRGDFGQGVRHGNGISGMTASERGRRRAPGDRRPGSRPAASGPRTAPSAAVSGPRAASRARASSAASDSGDRPARAAAARASVGIVGVGRQARDGDQPAAQVRQGHRHRRRRRAGPLVEPAHRVDELERRGARRIGHGAQRPAPERDGDERRQADHAELGQRRRQRRPRGVRPCRSAMPVIVLVPQHAPIERRPDGVDQQLDVAGLVDGGVGRRQRRHPVDHAAAADPGRDDGGAASVGVDRGVGRLRLAAARRDDPCGSAGAPERQRAGGDRGRRRRRRRPHVPALVSDGSQRLLLRRPAPRRPPRRSG